MKPQSKKTGEREYSLGTRRKERGRDGDDLSRKRGEIFQIN